MRIRFVSRRIVLPAKHLQRIAQHFTVRLIQPTNAFCNMPKSHQCAPVADIRIFSGCNHARKSFDDETFTEVQYTPHLIPNDTLPSCLTPSADQRTVLGTPQT
ncbi:unnamed protein product, partial [Ectocarpus fasciculatus]